MSKYYGVVQSHYGHEYRWIFKEETVRQVLGSEAEPESGALDIRWPMGGSNSSATLFYPIETDEDARAFLTAPGNGPDLEDPTLVDLAEYLVTVETDEGCAEEFLDRLRLSAEALTQYDDAFGRRESCEQMADELCRYRDFLHRLGTEFENCEEIDFNDLFYGDSKDMRYSDLCDLYERFLSRKDDWDKEAEEDVTR